MCHIYCGIASCRDNVALFWCQINRPSPFPSPRAPQCHPSHIQPPSFHFCLLTRPNDNVIIIHDGLALSSVVLVQFRRRIICPSPHGPCPPDTSHLRTSYSNFACLNTQTTVYLTYMMVSSSHPRFKCDFDAKCIAHHPLLLLPNTLHPQPFRLGFLFQTPK
jgi:hypothetical protein